MQLKLLIFFLCLNGFFFPGICQDTVKLISSIDQRLSAGQATITEVLSDTSIMLLHSLTSFRNVIQEHATAGKFRMISDVEPGKRITVKGKISDEHANPMKDSLVYVYQTSDKGWYSDTAAHVLINEGDMRHARLFAYFKTDDEGKFEYETIMPKGYPRSDLPAHIHIAVWSGKQTVYGLPDELLFEEDPRLTPAGRSHAMLSGDLISKNSGSEKAPVYFYDMVVKK